MDLENFPTRETAKDMLSMISPIYDRSYVGKWIFQVMAASMELARETVEDMKNRGQEPRRKTAPDCAEAQHKTPYESVPYCSPGYRNFRAGD